MTNPTTQTNQETHDVVIVGAGQAGLSLSWYLTRHGVEHILLEKDCIASDWKKRRWENFTLVTPNWHCQLPGFGYSGNDPDGFMSGPEVYDFVRRFATSFNPPVRESVEVTELVLLPDGGFRVTTNVGTMSAKQVVIATGGYHRPKKPAFANSLDDSIHQLHSADYRSSDQLPDGGVLVVGTGQSGTQIAEDLHLEGRKVHLAVGNAPRVARTYRGRDCMDWLNEMGVYDVQIQAHAGGLAKRENTNHYVTGRGGGRDIDLRQFAREGMQLHGHLTGARGKTAYFATDLARSLDHADSVAESIKNDIDRYIEAEGIDVPTEQRYRAVWEPESEPQSVDLVAAGITSIIWATGFTPDYRWVKVGVFDGEGHPTHVRGVTGVDGLYFLGLPWLDTWGSGRFAAIARDARHIASAVVRTELSEPEPMVRSSFDRRHHAPAPARRAPVSV